MSRSSVWAAKTALRELLAARNDLSTALVQLHLPARPVKTPDRVYIFATDNATSTPADNQTGILREVYEVQVLCESQRPGTSADSSYSARNALVDAIDALLVEDPELDGAVTVAWRSGITTETTNPLSDNTGWISRALVTVHCEALI